MGVLQGGLSPNTMSLFSNSKLHAAWSTRSWEIKAQSLQDASDLLYDHLRRDFVARRQTLQADLLEVIKTAGSLRDLHIPLWTYHASCIPPLDRGEYAKVQSHLRRHGYEWSIGLVHPDFDPENTETWGWEWQWKSRPSTVKQLVKHTDLLRRLSLLFGADFYVTVCPVAVKTLDDLHGIKVYKNQLQLHYYPKGLPQNCRENLLYIQEKYADYAAPVHEEHVHLWTGVPSVVEPPLPPSRCSTPPPPLEREEPPPLPQRSNGGGIERDLSGGRVLVYEGADALERAARDMVADTTCYCSYEW